MRPKGSGFDIPRPCQGAVEGRFTGAGTLSILEVTLAVTGEVTGSMRLDRVVPEHASAIVNL